MPFYKIDTEQKTLEELKPSNFSDIPWDERKDLQPLFRNNIESIDSDLLIIAEEFGNWEDSKRRIDLLGLDVDGNLVVIELKRVKDAGHSELQAIRYAAMVSTMDFEDVVNAHEEFITKLGKDANDARSKIRDFLGLEDDEEALISNKPRIILVAPSFSQEITTTVLWLNEQNVDISCIQLKLYDINNEKFLNIEQIIPLPSAQDYQVKIREKTNKAVREASNQQRREKSIKILIDYGKLQDGMKIYLRQSPKPGLNINDIDEKAKYATFQATQKNFKWDFDGQNYSLSTLCRKICEHHNVPVGKGAFPGPDYWAIEDQEKSLSDYAKELIKDFNTEIA
ncbi:hypothetical protein MEO93_21655 [Dolichospermum sp. ST_sed3]|nr:hypothetical protein [Dolichospermum sp. ST_sed9]MDD1433654.1 hypothetical protein [Dolichospermum sp. ST_sed6]MDD1442915.1 hypothetical protein [Dolichospermum sp. ST_sed3]MDD1448615.1 hypothetical protein [Dolichospermum sp. ST_sed8]MDD1457171.1 hypothetical protein [Dolichospermum sp. ST_sed7]MDD1462673.1 hypothetical protein [Dolichospermum sp. ST_sed2]MDD1467265.1 hypothetical protein [Dolichospermum sp. ST_sed5]MDD1473845.1 hypothetical protein [Dolichospermum sp. ST_sed4]